MSTSLPQQLIEYWSLLVDSLHILLQRNISVTELNIANRKIRQFICETEHFFGKVAMTYNIHQLSHLCDNVAAWGPLWAHSAYAFESQNRHLLAAIKSPKGVLQQIMRSINIYRSLILIERKINIFFPHEVIDRHDDLKFLKVENSLKISINIRYFGHGESVGRNLLRDLFNFDQANSRMFSRIVKERCLYMSCMIQNRRSCNYYAQLKDKRFIRIWKFFVDTSNLYEKTLYFSIAVEQLPFCEYTYVIREENDTIEITDTDNLESVCVMSKFGDSMYISAFPNLLWY